MIFLHFYIILQNISLHYLSHKMFCVSGGRTIIFTETKDSASQLAGILPGARALHGDIQQATREVNYH